MTTEPGFPKKVCIQIYHIPSGATYQNDEEKVYKQNNIDEIEKLCKIFTNKDAVNCRIVCGGQAMFFPAGVLQQSIIRLIVKPV